MALLEGMAFTGTLGDLSAYHMRGTEKIVVRKKGGASKEKIKKSPRFALPRLYMSEFGGCSTMGREVRRMLMPVKTLADYNISGPINKILKIVQKQDTSALGRRSILLSEHPRLLEGFSLNEKNPFDSIIRNTLTWSLDRETGSARIEIPALMRDINFFPQNRHPLFSIVVSLGVVPDFTFNESWNRYEPPAWYKGFGPMPVSTPWYPALEGSPATTLEVALNKIPADASYSLMLSIGIRFGALYEEGLIEQVKRVGAAKILALRGGDTFGSVTPNDDGTKKDTMPVKEVTPSLPQDMKDTKTDSSASIETVAKPEALQYVYTLRQEDASVAHVNAQVYTYTIERNEPAGEEQKIAVTSTLQDVVKEKSDLSGENLCMVSGHEGANGMLVKDAYMGANVQVYTYTTERNAMALHEPMIAVTCMQKNDGDLKTKATLSFQNSWKQARRLQGGAQARRFRDGGATPFFQNSRRQVRRLRDGLRW